MGIFEPWVADCHLVNTDTTEEFQCRAAIWADSYKLFRARLTEYLQNKKLRLLWLEECLPAAQYISRHGQQRSVGDLSRAVHVGHPVKLSELAGLLENVDTQPEAILNIRAIRGIEPLGIQLGASPRMTVPAALWEPLFGQPRAEACETDRYGSADTVPPLRSYAVLDAAKMPYMLTTLLNASGLRYQSLFQGETGGELTEHSPYLVELEETNRFTEKLFTGPTGIGGLWEKDLGIYLRARSGFDEMRRHLRKFTRIQDQNGKWFMFRFWEPGIIAQYLRSSSPEVQKRFFSHPQTVLTGGASLPWEALSVTDHKDTGVQPEIRLTMQNLAAFQELARAKYCQEVQTWLEGLYPELQSSPDRCALLRSEVHFLHQRYPSLNQSSAAHYLAASWLLGERAFGNKKLPDNLSWEERPDMQVIHNISLDLYQRSNNAF